MRILQYPTEEAALRAPSTPITKEEIQTPEFKKMIQDMIALLQESKDGIGISGGQLDIKRNLFILACDEQGNPANYQVYLNPVILWAKGKNRKNEGCLSFSPPILYVKVDRPFQIMWSYKTLDWDTKFIESSDYYCHIISHEIDHGQGLLLIDSMPKSQNNIFKKWLIDRLNGSN